MNPAPSGFLALAFLLLESTTFAASLSPANWPVAERLELERLEQQARPDANRIVEGREGFVAGTLSPIAVRAGIEVLKQGGTAADAATAVALTQVSTSLGSVVSYAGIAQILYFEAKSGQIHSIDAGWASYLGETDPNSIPDLSATRQAGRKTLVPGFMAGMETMQKRFGVLPFGDLFEPAIWYAENGVTISQSLANFFRFRAKELSRTKSGRQFMQQGGGKGPVLGNKFVQTELGQTLRAVAQHGSQYMYGGAWGQSYVEAVRQEGGKVTLEDLQRYQPIEQESLSTTFAGHIVFGPGRSSEGGYQALAALNLIEELKIDALPPYWADPESFRRLSRVLNMTDVLPEWMLARARSKGVDLAMEDRASKSFAVALAPLMEDFFTAPAKTESSAHTAGIVVVDRHGNVAAIVHSINTVLWGTTGMVVGGIPVADVAAQSQSALSALKPGERLRDSMTPLPGNRAHRPWPSPLQRRHAETDDGAAPARPEWKSKIRVPDSRTQLQFRISRASAVRGFDFRDRHPTRIEKPAWDRCLQPDRAGERPLAQRGDCRSVFILCGLLTNRPQENVTRSPMRMQRMVMMRRAFGCLFLLTGVTLVGGAAEPAPKSRPLFPATLTCFMAKIDSGSSCSLTLTQVPEPDPRSRWRSAMTCGWPGQVSELRWEFLGSEGGADVYQITRRFPADAETSETVTQTIKYAGKQLIVFADNYHVVVVDPPKPPGSERKKSQQPARAKTG